MLGWGEEVVGRGGAASPLGVGPAARGGRAGGPAARPSRREEPADWGPAGRLLHPRPPPRLPQPPGGTEAEAESPCN